MNRPVKFLIIFAILLLCSVNAVSADNFTDVNETASDHPLITVNTTEVYFNESVSISLRDSDDAALSNQDILAGIDGKNYTLTTDSEGKADLYLNLKPNTYPLDVFFKGEILLISAFGTVLEIGKEALGILALAPICLYNGRKGRGGKIMQYIGYGFYPAHMLLLHLIRYFM